MALSKARNHKGATITYWKIVKLDMDYVRNRVMAQVKGYVSKAVRDANIDDNLDQVTFVYDGADNPTTHAGNNVAQVYAKIKQDADWTDATDIIEE